MKVLVVAFADSITTARWLSQLDGTGWEVHLISPYWPCIVHPELRGVTLHGADLWRQPQLHESVRLAGAWPFNHGGYRIQELLGKIVTQRSRVDQLCRVIKRVKPDIIHSLEMQHSAYLTLDAKRKMDGAFPPWIYSCWGSDIFRFSRQEEHQWRIRAVLESCDYLFTDCQRDLRLAREWGFMGEVLGVVPGGGGLDVHHFRTLVPFVAPSQRRVIAVKGYHDEVCGGRALHALAALEGLRDELSGYEIVVYSATTPVKEAVQRLQAEGQLNCRILPPSCHDDMIRLMGHARIALAIGLSDGTPNALLEAMAMGAFPVQSDTLSTREWLTHGRTGYLVNPESVAEIRGAVARALADDGLVDAAELLNYHLVRERCDASVVRPKVLATYQAVVNTAASGSVGHAERVQHVI